MQTRWLPFCAALDPAAASGCAVRTRVAAALVSLLVAGERCAGLSEGARYLESETLAAVMAHELGHFLGLLHVREADGRQDTLADTDADVANLMSTRPSAGAKQLTEFQISIARRHAALAVSRWSRRNESEN
ncbi:MAG: hypothetical protein RLZZ450_6373 [Pseudomonadota bacterium]|jgi:Zn-dependent protease with chaperone function